MKYTASLDDVMLVIDFERSYKRGDAHLYLSSLNPEQVFIIKRCLLYFIKGCPYDSVKRDYTDMRLYVINYISDIVWFEDNEEWKKWYYRDLEYVI